MARSSQRGGGSQILSPNAARRGNPIQFFQETVSELRRCVWPTREETIRLSVYVIIFATAASIVLAGVDRGLQETFTRFILR